MSNRITYQVLPPNCAGNIRSQWKCDVRNCGFIADWQFFDTEQEAETWGKSHSGESSQKATNAIGQMAKRWAEK
jgi:hypothetical protein